MAVWRIKGADHAVLPYPAWQILAFLSHSSSSDPENPNQPTGARGRVREKTACSGKEPDCFLGALPRRFSELARPSHSPASQAHAWSIWPETARFRQYSAVSSSFQRRSFSNAANFAKTGLRRPGHQPGFVHLYRRASHDIPVQCTARSELSHPPHLLNELPNISVLR